MKYILLALSSLLLTVSCEKEYVKHVKEKKIQLGIKEGIEDFKNVIHKNWQDKYLKKAEEIVDSTLLYDAKYRARKRSGFNPDKPTKPVKPLIIYPKDTSKIKPLEVIGR